MNYPLISEYIEAIKSAEDNFEQLKNLRPVLGDDGMPVMTSGNFAVVSKMRNGRSGMFYMVSKYDNKRVTYLSATLQSDCTILLLLHGKVAILLYCADIPYLCSKKMTSNCKFYLTGSTHGKGNRQ